MLARTVLLFQAAQQKITESQLGDDKLQQMYQDQIADFTTVQADHILVKTEAEAQDVYQQVTAPGATRDDFLALAKEVSIDPSAKQNSGSLGSAVAATYVPEFAAAVVGLEPGEISQPVQDRVRLARDPPRGQAGHAVRRGEAAAGPEPGASSCSTSGSASQAESRASR